MCVPSNKLGLARQPTRFCEPAQSNVLHVEVNACTVNSSDLAAGGCEHLRLDTRPKLLRQEPLVLPHCWGTTIFGCSRCSPTEGCYVFSSFSDSDQVLGRVIVPSTGSTHSPRSLNQMHHAAAVFLDAGLSSGRNVRRGTLEWDMSQL